MFLLFVLNFMIVTPVSAATIKETIHSASVAYGVNESHLLETLRCESKLNPNAIGDGGNSYGIAQIHLPSHPKITKTQALNPTFSIWWTAAMFAGGDADKWTCWRILYS